MTDSYLTVPAVAVATYEQRRSRFVAALSPATDEDEARAFIASRRKAEPGARHHCHAFVIGAHVREQRSSDDGEPAGTAGVPILEVLLHAELTNLVAVVSRHFGGVKLGAGGLVRAYGNAVSAALAQAGTVRRQRLELYTVAVEHAAAGKLEHELRQSEYLVRAVQYGAHARLTVGVPAGERDRFETWIAERTAGSAAIEAMGEDWV